MEEKNWRIKKNTGRDFVIEKAPTIENDACYDTLKIVDSEGETEDNLAIVKTDPKIGGFDVINLLNDKVCIGDEVYLLDQKNGWIWIGKIKRNPSVEAALLLLKAYKEEKNEQDVS